MDFLQLLKSILKMI